MPLLTAAQIEELRGIIQDGATALSVTTFGDEVTEEELQRLVEEGYVDPEVLDDLALNAFTYGQLMDKLPAARGMTFPQFAAYLRQNPVALSGPEREAYKIAAQRAGTFCRGLGNRYSDELGKIVVNADAELAQQLRAGIAGEVSESIALREGRGTLVRRLRQMSGQMTRDWTRIAATESHLAHQEGLFEDVAGRKGEGVLMAKVPDSNACSACLAAYRGEDGKPIVKPASWWAAQGSNNVGRKKAEWKPVLGAMHPWCVVPGQVVTTHRGLVPIEEVKVGDLVVTAKGRWRPVRQVFRHFYSDEVVELFTESHGIVQRLVVTPNHLVGGDWKAAKLIREGAELRSFADPEDRPSRGDEVLRLATVLLCLDGAGVPVPAIDLNGRLRSLPAQINEVASDDGVVLDGEAAAPQSAAHGALKRGVGPTSLPAQSFDDRLVVLCGAAARLVCSAGQTFALIGAEILHADLLTFASRARRESGILDALDEGAAAHPELTGYRQYGSVVLEVESENERGIDIAHDPILPARSATVKKVGSSHYQGYVYNLGVDEDQSYLVQGLAVHNCQCQLVEVPEGFEFDETDSLVPSEDRVAEPATLAEEPVEKAEKGYAGPFIGPRGGKWADPRHTIPWHERIGEFVAAQSLVDKAKALREISRDHDLYTQISNIGGGRGRPRQLPDAVWEDNVAIAGNPAHPEHAEVASWIERMHDKLRSRVAPTTEDRKAEAKRRKAAAEQQQREKAEHVYERQGVEVEEGTPPSKLRGEMVWLYHGTSDKHLPFIRAEGLRTAAEHGRKRSNVGSSGLVQANPNYVYLSARATGAASAEGYARAAAYKTGGDPVILRVLVSGDDLARDPDDKDIASGRYQYVTDRVTVEQIKEIDGERIEKARKLHGRRIFQGFEVSIENRAGSVRHWHDHATGEEGRTKMEVPYGYIRRTQGVDGDHVDVFLGPDESAQTVYVIHQLKPPDFTRFDEDKVMLGFSNGLEARRAYRAHYTDPRFFGAMTPMGLEEFRRKVYATAEQPRMIKAEKPGQQLGLFTGSGGPFLGPRGGKWADPKHTRHWEPPAMAETERGAEALRQAVPAIATVFVNASGGAEKKRFREAAGHLAEMNVGIQIVAHEIPSKPSALKRYGEAGKKGLRVMVDSGEFGRFSANLAASIAETKAQAAPGDSTAAEAARAARQKAEEANAAFSFDTIFDRYEALAKVMPSGTLQVVAPDRIADSQATAQLREQYAPRVRKLQEMGAEVIVPVQARDPEGMAQDYIRITEAFGQGVILGFPTAKAPVEMDAILPFAVSLYSAGRFPKLHFLGATEPAKLGERSVQLVAAAYFAGRGIGRDRILELVKTPRDAARALRNVKTQDDVLTRESDYLLQSELTDWARKEVVGTELVGGPLDPDSEDFDETEAWPQFMEAHPEEYDLSIRGARDKEGLFRELAGKLSQSDSQVVGRVQRYGKEHDPVTGQQVVQSGAMEATEKVERFVPLLDRYLQAKEHVAETLVPPARSGFMALFGDYAKSLFSDPDEFWKAELGDFYPSGSNSFTGYSGAGGGAAGPVGVMGHQGAPARTPGQNVLDTEPVTEWPPFLHRPLRTRRKLQRAAERFDVQGLKQSAGGFANPPNNAQVQAEAHEVEKDIGRSAVSGHRYREELEERQRRRVADRRTPVLDEDLQEYHRGVRNER